MGRTYPSHEIAQLAKGDGEVIWADGCLAILKALLESGVAYVGGYPGAPVSNLTDAFLDAEEPILKPMGVFVANNVNEASAAAMLRFSVNAPVRGAVAWKVVGTNVAADALAHICSSGVQGGCCHLCRRGLRRQQHPRGTKNAALRLHLWRSRP